MKVPVTNIASVGVVTDQPGQELPPEAWTSAKNVRFRDGSASKINGYTPVFSTPSAAPYWIIPAFTPSQPFWVCGCIGSLRATDGSTDGVLRTGLGGTRDSRWNGGMFGGIGIFNNGVANPQMWTPPSLATATVDLTNWPGTLKAKVVRPFNRYLVAYNVTKSGTQFPQRLKWSSSAPIGAVPATWDETDATQDSREWDLVETYGQIVDAKQLGEVNFVYKQDETHSMVWTGGTFVFSIKRAFPFGAMAQDCIVEYKKKHFVAAYDDVYVHDGVSWESLLDAKMRRWYAGRMDQPQRSWMVRSVNDMILGFCEAGGTEPTLALRMNLKDGSCTVQELPSVSFMTNSPVVISSTAPVFNAVGTTFDDTPGTFGLGQVPVGIERFLGTVPGKPFFGMFDDNTAFSDQLFSGLLERTGLTISGVDRFQRPKNDPTTVKQVHKLWPKMKIENGIQMKISMAAVTEPDDPYVWQTKVFDPAVAPYVEFEDLVGVYLGVQFSDDNQIGDWRLDSYDVEMDIIGQNVP